MMSPFLQYQLTGFITLTKKEITRILRIWKMTIAPPLLTTYLFCTIFGTVLGDRIGEIRDVNYLIFIIPGLLMNVAVLEAFNNSSSSLMIDKFHRVTDTTIASPVHESVLLLSVLIGSLTRVLLVLSFLLPLTYFLSHALPQDYALFLAVVCMSTLFFSLFGMITGLYATRFDELSTIPTFVLTPLSFFSGVFYDVNYLPEPWRSLSAFNPMVYLVRLFRYSYLPTTQLDVSTLLVGLFVALLALFLLVLKLVQRGWGLKQ